MNFLTCPPYCIKFVHFMHCIRIEYISFFGNSRIYICLYGWFIGSHYTVTFSLSLLNLTLLTFIGAATFFLGAIALFNS